ncbi:MAG: DinB family protein [Bacteroidota bacterium]|nr:DinB family protein [Bacteroidota bacterium]
MQYNFQKALEILERTPNVLNAQLKDLSDDWIFNNEGPDTFSPFDVMGHLIHGEKTDWRDRISMLVEFGTEKTFIPYDRFAMYKESEGKSLQNLLDEFSTLRKQNISWLTSLDLTETDLDKVGMHPSLGNVRLRQLLSTWVIHDLTHTAQIARVMAKQLKEEMGPWLAYFRIMNF